MQCKSLMTMFSRILLLFSILSVAFSIASAQRLVGTDTLYGNEWLVQSEYIKVKVTDAGVFSISQAELNGMGWGSVSGNELKLSFLGEEQSMYVSNDGSWSTDDFLFFYADEEKFAAYEAEIFSDGLNSNINSDRKLFSDTMTYYLSREPGPRLRYSVKDPVTAAPTVFDTSLMVSVGPLQTASTFHSRRTNSDGAQSSRFTAGDGWAYRNARSTTLTFDHVDIDTNFELVFNCRSVSSTYNASGVTRGRDIRVNGASLFLETSTQNQLYDDEISFDASQLASGNRTVFLFTGSANNSDRYAVGKSTLQYHRFTKQIAGGFTWETSSGVSVNPVKWDDVSPTEPHFALDIGRDVLQEVNTNIPFSDVGVNETGQRGIYFSFSDLRSPTLEPLEVENLGGESADYLIITSKKLDSLNMNADDYAAFRSNSIHGGYDVAILDVEDLVDHFGYGVPNDPRAIRNAINYYADNGNAKRVLLFGKGRTFTGVRTPIQIATSTNASYFVPSFGIPASDNLLALNPLTKNISVSLGRLSVQNAEQVEVAIEKYSAEADVANLSQTIDSRFWTKQTVIIGGGKEPVEQNFLKNFLLGFTDVLARGDLGIEATGLFKTTTEPVQLSASEAYYKRVNEGVSLITFFGHAASTTLDVTIDDFTQYNNEGKYPLFIGLGCYAGDANSPNESLSESFVFEPRKSMSGFMSSVGLSYPSSTARFASNFYSRLTGASFGLPISDALRDELNASINSLNFQLRDFAEQLVYQGDPAARLFVAEGTDLIINEDAITVGPLPLISSLDSISIALEVLNLGKSDTSRFEIEWTRQALTSNEVQKDTVLVLGGVSARKQVQFNIPSLFQDGRGSNELSFRILPRVSQLPSPAALQNDGTSPYSFFVASSVVNILWPENNSIVAPEDLRLVANFGNAWASTSTYEVEVSRDADFSSLSEQQSLVEKSLMRYDLQGSYAPGEVVFARVKLEIDTVWESISFRVGEAASVYGRGVKGYNQAAEGTTDELGPRTTGDWQFGDEGSIRVLTNKQYDPADPPTFAQNLATPYISVLPWQFLDAGIAILVADSLTGDEFRNAPPQYGSIDCGSPNRAFAYPTSTPAERQLVVDFLNTVPNEGEFVYVFTIYRDTTSLDPADWALDTTRGFSESINSVLRTRGAQRLDDWAIRGTVPYTFMYREGGEVLKEDLGMSREDVIVSTISVPLRARRGEYLSPRYANIDSVYAFSWFIDSTQIDTSNFVTVNLLGYDQADQATILATSSSFSGRIELLTATGPDFSEFAISITQTDEVFRKAMPLISAELFARERPELVFDPAIQQTLVDSTLKPGQKLTWSIGLANISPTKSDSLSASLSNLESNEQFGTVRGFSSIESWGTSVWSGEEDLGRESGLRELAFSIAPYQASNDKYNINNLAFASINVEADVVDPLLRLHVDGDNIRTGMLISPEPIIEIQLTDDFGVDNSLPPEEYLNIEFTSPSGQLYASNVNLLGSLRAIDTTDASKLSYEYEPGRLEHGVWSLKVLAADRYGNSTGESSIAYELLVDTTVSVSSFLPYPNPAVDRVFFQYELTGQVPIDYQVDIYTTSGRLINSIGPEVLGPLQIGQRRTEGFWNGTDMYGQPLSRGVYLYRLSFGQSSQGESFESRSTGADAFFKSGFGKLVLLR